MAIDQDITNLPTPPSRSDSPSDFSDKADAFLGALPQFRTELNTYADEANSTQNAINTSEGNAETSEQNAEDWASDLSGLVLSTDYSSKAYAISNSLVPDGSSKEWSSKTDGTVDTTEYSSKAYALGGTGVTDVVGAAKEWAITTGSTVDGSEYSAKDYANSENVISVGSSKEWATKTGSTVDGTEFSAKKYAQDASDFADSAAAVTSATEWESATTYSKNDAVIGSDGNTYRSLTDNNTGNDPVSDIGSNWLNLTATLSDQEVRDLFSASGDLTYDSATGEFSITASETPLILQPEPVSPADNATDIGETPTLDGGTYYSLYGKTHAISRFQVADDDQFSNIVYDSGEISGTETHDVPSGNLVESTTYYWRVYYEDEDGVESEFSDTFEFTTGTSVIEVPSNIQAGDAFAGGFFVGYIDTVAGTIDSQDDYQTGERYALVVAPKSLETGPGPKWDSQGRTGEAGSFTRWDGLSSTDSILAKNDSSYEAFEHIRSIRTSDPVPSDGGSDWYVPAMDELELIYRNLKPVNADNSTFDSTETFPGQQNSGFNPSSDPTGSAYTSTGEPFQTSVTAFQNGGAESVDLERYWSSTDPDSSQSWVQNFRDFFGDPALQRATDKDKENSVRPVRRIPV